MGVRNLELRGRAADRARPPAASRRPWSSAARFPASARSRDRSDGIAEIAGRRGSGRPRSRSSDRSRHCGTASWLEQAPLHGRSVVVTRARAQASTLAARLSHGLGATVIEAPAIRIEPRDRDPVVAEAVRRSRPASTTLSASRARTAPSSCWTRSPQADSMRGLAARVHDRPGDRLALAREGPESRRRCRRVDR